MFSFHSRYFAQGLPLSCPVYVCFKLSYHQKEKCDRYDSAGDIQSTVCTDTSRDISFPSLLLEYPIASVPIPSTLSSTSPSNQANINQGKRNKQSVCGVSPSSAPSEPLVRSRARFLRSGSNTVAILSGS
ncbi:hypothetical protein RRG08_044194 [Elysia crispata]|uniref:ZP domain-containing protein n=1 Tax=Elysia crispata TaxID=231223 RepID=A0AAE0XY38_9GAST|nr:hypothetical protein RRG08_044194 [Elysia crispata]